MNIIIRVAKNNLIKGSAEPFPPPFNLKFGSNGWCYSVTVGLVKDISLLQILNSLLH